jgi:hypothetical protein
MPGSDRAFCDRFRPCAVLLILACVLTAVPLDPAQGRPVRTTSSSVPAPVLGAFNDAYPKAEILEMASLAEGGKVQYEIKGVDAGTSLTVIYRANGTLVAVEEDIATEFLPEAVTAAVETRHPGSKIVKAVRTTRDGATTYLLRVAAGGRRLNLVLDQDGTLIGAKDTGGGKRK